MKRNREALARIDSDTYLLTLYPKLRVMECLDLVIACNHIDSILSGQSIVRIPCMFVDTPAQYHKTWIVHRAQQASLLWCSSCFADGHSID